jgi:hypothetical protein
VQEIRRLLLEINQRACQHNRHCHKPLQTIRVLKKIRRNINSNRPTTPTAETQRSSFTPQIRSKNLIQVHKATGEKCVHPAPSQSNTQRYLPNIVHHRTADHASNNHSHRNNESFPPTNFVTRKTQE